MAAPQGRSHADLRADVSLLLGGSSSPGTVLADRITRALNDAVDTIHQNYRLSAMRKDGGVQLVTGQETYDLPDDLQALVPHTVHYAPTGFTLEHVTEDVWNERALNRVEHSGTPRLYTDFNRGGGASSTSWTIKIRPRPSASEAGQMVDFMYYRLPVSMPGTDLANEFPDLPAQFHNGLKYVVLFDHFFNELGTEALQVAASKRAEVMRQIARGTDILTSRASSFRRKGVGRVRRAWWGNTEIIT